MRFGKKLALQVMDDGSGAPYLSHKPMKEAINKTVRELRTYQSRLQDLDLSQHDVAAQKELRELEDNICSFDRKLFMMVDDDLANLLSHVRLSEAELAEEVGIVHAAAQKMGLILEDAWISEMENHLHAPLDNSDSLSKTLLDMMAACDTVGMASRLDDVNVKYNTLVEMLNQHTNYVEINVAGFRKLLKRHEKQIPARFRVRQMPFLGFHHLVTRSTRQLLDVTRQLGDIISDAWDRLVMETQREMPHLTRPELTALRGLGLECEMVLSIKKQLRNPLGSQLTLMDSNDCFGGSSPVGRLYVKPENNAANQHKAQGAGNASHGAKLQQQQQQQHQQQHHQQHQQCHQQQQPRQRLPIQGQEQHLMPFGMQAGYGLPQSGSQPLELQPWWVMGQVQTTQ